LSLSLRTRRVLLHIALVLASVPAISATPPLETSAKRRPTICELMGDPAAYAGHFVVLSGRLVKESGDFALVDDACPSAVVVLKNSGTLDVLGLACKPKEPLSGLTCMFERNPGSIMVTASGTVSQAQESNGRPFLSIWDVSNVAVVPAPNQRLERSRDSTPIGEGEDR
jgi:hypothetical protein